MRGFLLRDSIREGRSGVGRVKAVKEPGEEVGENPEDSGVTGGGGRGGAAAPTDIKKGGFVYVCVRGAGVLCPCLSERCDPARLLSCARAAGDEGPGRFR